MNNKKKSAILTETGNSLRNKLYDTIRENQNYCHRNAQLFDKVNDNLISFDDILGKLRNLQETVIITSWRYKFSFMEPTYDKKFQKQLAFLRGQWKKTKNFNHSLKKAWDVMEKSCGSQDSEDGIKLTISDSDNSEAGIDKYQDIKSPDQKIRKVNKHDNQTIDKERVEKIQHALYEPIVDEIVSGMKRKADIPKHMETEELSMLDKLEVISKFLRA